MVKKAYGFLTLKKIHQIRKNREKNDKNNFRKRGIRR